LQIITTLSQNNCQLSIVNCELSMKYKYKLIGLTAMGLGGELKQT